MPDQVGPVSRINNPTGAMTTKKTMLMNTGVLTLEMTGAKAIHTR